MSIYSAKDSSEESLRNSSSKSKLENNSFKSVLRSLAPAEDGGGVEMTGPGAGVGLGSDTLIFSLGTLVDSIVLLDVVLVVSTDWLSMPGTVV